MSPFSHRIRRLTWQLQTPTPQSAFAQRSAIAKQFESTFLPSFERVFDRYSVDDRILVIPKLTLRITTDLASMEGLAARIEEQLNRLLFSYATPFRSPRPAVTAIESHSVPNQSSPIENEAKQGVEDRPVEARYLDEDEFGRAVLIKYLRSGRIDWQAHASDNSQIGEMLQTEAEKLQAEEPQSASRFDGTLESRMAMCFRFLQLLPPPVRAEIARTVVLPPNVFVVSLTQTARDAAPGSSIQLRLTTVLLALREQDLPKKDSSSFGDSHSDRSIHETLRKFLIDQPLLLDKFEVACAIDPGSSPPVHQAVEPIQPQRNRSANGTLPAMDAAPSIPSDLHGTGIGNRERSRAMVSQASSIDHQPPSSVEDDDDITWRIRTVDPPVVDDVEGILADDAGLILLHSFLPRLFEAVGLVIHAKGPLPTLSLPKAAALLHWLVTGRQSVYEYELTLAKVLLGLTPSEPLMVDGGLLTETDRAEGDAMLLAVVQYWTALRKTSLTGLRTTFLQRRGLLREDDQQWRLRVESRPFDLLIGQLPWGINPVKLPWMKKPIFTDWPTQS